LNPDYLKLLAFVKFLRMIQDSDCYLERKMKLLQKESFLHSVACSFLLLLLRSRSNLEVHH